ncbi:BON domain-containing protein [Variovorax sp. J22P168]|uniref:BON domain-containing protein n=1 Tax=Variovorax jilinensis TaxID=3053513 RepID=UPI002575C044|nr:BON domain-containing protein [Variovorax sp. J22P168]MDM0013560.1 BON domain-containing protein [Variovorax sp. J22P168]
MKNSRLFIAIAAASCVLAFTACTDRGGSQADADRRQIDAAVDKTGAAAAAAAEKAAELAETARDKTRAFIASPETKQDAAAIKDAIKGAGAAAMGSVDDAAITLSVHKALARDSDLSAQRIDVDTKAGVVRLTGSAPSEAARTRASDLAGSVQGVTTVDNALQVRTM